MNSNGLELSDLMLILIIITIIIVVIGVYGGIKLIKIIFNKVGTTVNTTGGGLSLFTNIPKCQVEKCPENAKYIERRNLYLSGHDGKHVKEIRLNPPKCMVVGCLKNAFLDDRTKRYTSACGRYHTGQLNANPPKCQVVNCSNIAWRVDEYDRYSIACSIDHFKQLTEEKKEEPELSADFSKLDISPFGPKRSVMNPDNEYEDDSIVAFYYGAFGNFNEAYGKFEYNDIFWKTAEGAYQWDKLIDGPYKTSRIEKYSNATGEKVLGLTRSELQKNKKPRHIWNSQSEETMTEILQAKFETNDALFEKLMRTGNKYIVEHIPVPNRDKYYGDNFDGTGKNLLGNLLMDLRKRKGGGSVVGKPIGLLPIDRKPLCRVCSVAFGRYEDTGIHYEQGFDSICPLHDK